MKQIVQHLRDGRLELLEVPCPLLAPGHLLIQTRASVISSGTERSLVEFARGSLLSKAYQQPDRLKQALQKAQVDGAWATIESIRTRLDEPLPLGYCNAGVVVATGDGVTRLKVGDRVASNGAHAELVHVPSNLAVQIPVNVSDEEAAFAVLGSIALQGIRLLKPELCETITVFGLGLVGQLAVQLLAASGVKVIGVDVDAKRVALAEKFGAIPVHAGTENDLAGTCRELSQGYGVDGVLVTASSRNDDILRQSARMCRQRGRIVLVGVVDAKFDRTEFYEKELSFQVSCSYGPGRYDPQYEQQGIDYPYGLVRWTENRNIAAVLEMMANGLVDPTPLVAERIPHANAQYAYESLTKKRSALAIVLTYPEDSINQTRQVLGDATAVPDNRIRVASPGDNCVVGIIGAGHFAKSTLLPALKQTTAKLQAIASANGLNAAHLAAKFGIAAAHSDYHAILDDPSINTVVVLTRHDLHAKITSEALQAGKHVFVEKPLAISADGLKMIQQAWEATEGQLMVGFNRRFSPLAQTMQELLSTRTQPASLIITVNAPRLPQEHWIHDPAVGGGPIIGEGCHWVDLAVYLLNSHIATVHAVATPATPVSHAYTVTMTHEDGSIATLNYFMNGHRVYPKETIDVFSDGRVLRLENFRRLIGHGWPNFRRQKLFRQDKGHRHQLNRFVKSIIQSTPPLIPPSDLWNTTAATFGALNSIARREMVLVRAEENPSK